jgi:hypothetical protein
MPSKLALKKLTQSDLTFFKWHFINHPAGNQKAINLNADVFMDVLFPGLQAVADKNQGRILVSLQIYGPGLENELILARKIIKFGTYKNWRLNGEFIENPIESPSRFNSLVANDLVLFEFPDEDVPRSVKMLLVANAVPEDSGLHKELSRFIGKRSMVAIDTGQLQDVVSRVNPVAAHPIYEFLLEEELEDIALGGIEGIRKLRSKVSTRTVSQETLDKARFNAERAGRQGEEFVNAYFEKQKGAGEILDFEWTSSQNPISPYDFKLIKADGRTVFVDVKSTSTKLQNPIHISYNELLQICTGGERYDLYRVFEIHEGSAKMVIAEDVSSSLMGVYNLLNSLVDGVTVDGISVKPAFLPFGRRLIKLAV